MFFDIDRSLKIVILERSLFFKTTNVSKNNKNQPKMASKNLEINDFFVWATGIASFFQP